MPFSLAGLIAAAIGLYIGWLDYKIMTGVLRASVERKRKNRGDGGILGRYESAVRALIMVITIIGFPVVGYIAALQLVG